MRRLRLMRSLPSGTPGFPPGLFLSPLLPSVPPLVLRWLGVWTPPPLRVSPGHGRLPRSPERLAAVRFLSFDSDRKRRMEYMRADGMYMNGSCDALQAPAGPPAAFSAFPLEGRPVRVWPFFSGPSSLTDLHWRPRTRTHRHG